MSVRLNEEFLIYVNCDGHYGKLISVNGKRYGKTPYAITKTPYGTYTMTHIETGRNVSVTSYTKLKDLIYNADKIVESAEIFIKQNPDYIAIMKEKYDYCISHSLIGRKRFDGKHRNISVERIINNLIKRDRKFVRCLFESVCLYWDMPHSLYKDHFVLKWISIEYAFESNGIDITSNGENKLIDHLKVIMNYDYRGLFYEMRK